MSQANLIQPLVMIGDFYLDVTLSEEHNFDSDVTEFPVESGSSIVDNIRPKPIVIRIEGLVSNTPIGNTRTIRENNIGFIPGGDPKNKDKAYDVVAYDYLQRIRDKREPVPITTSLRHYENMALQNLSIPRATGRGDELRFTATFKQVEIVQNKRTTRVATPGAIGNKTLNKTTKPVLDSGPIQVIRLYRIPAWQAENTPDESLNAGFYVWYDPLLGSWRHEVSEGTFTTGGTTLNYKAYRRRPWGVSEAEWDNARKSDAEYRDIIAKYNAQNPPTVNKIFKYSPIVATTSPIVFSPGERVTVSTLSQVRYVKAMILDARLRVFSP